MIEQFCYVLFGDPQKQEQKDAVEKAVLVVVLLFTAAKRRQEQIE